MTQESGCKTIMIVEDDDGVLESIKDLLEAEGFQTVTARNGKEAIELLPRLERPCLILLDLFMPVMDGWGFLKELKLRPEDQIANIPIVITSAAGDRAKEAAKLAHGYIRKPIDANLLFATVKKYCPGSGT